MCYLNQLRQHNTNEQLCVFPGLTEHRAVFSGAHCSQSFCNRELKIGVLIGRILVVHPRFKMFQNVSSFST